MSVEFNEPASVMNTRAAAKPPSLLSRLLIKSGIVKTETGAQAVFVIIIILALAGTVFLFSKGALEPPAPTYEQIQP